MKLESRDFRTKEELCDFVNEEKVQVESIQREDKYYENSYFDKGYRPVYVLFYWKE